VVQADHAGVMAPTFRLKLAISFLLDKAMDVQQSPLDIVREA